MGAGDLQLWEQVAVGAIIVAVMFFMFPRISASMKQSKDQPRDWQGFLIPIGLVVLFVVFLISLA